MILKFTLSKINMKSKKKLVLKSPSVWAGKLTHRLRAGLIPNTYIETHHRLIAGEPILSTVPHPCPSQEPGMHTVHAHTQAAKHSYA